MMCGLTIKNLLNWTDLYEFIKSTFCKYGQMSYFMQRSEKCLKNSIFTFGLWICTYFESPVWIDFIQIFRNEKIINFPRNSWFSNPLIKWNWKEAIILSINTSEGSSQVTGLQKKLELELFCKIQTWTPTCSWKKLVDSDFNPTCRNRNWTRVHWSWTLPSTELINT